MSYTKTGIMKRKNAIGKVANGRSCLSAFQYWSFSVIGSYLDLRLKHTLRVSFITMTTIAADINRSIIMAGPSQRANLSTAATRRLVLLSSYTGM